MKYPHSKISRTEGRHNHSFWKIYLLYYSQWPAGGNRWLSFFLYIYSTIPSLSAFSSSVMGHFLPTSFPISLNSHVVNSWFLRKGIHAWRMILMCKCLLISYVHLHSFILKDWSALTAFHTEDTLMNTWNTISVLMELTVLRMSQLIHYSRPWL